MYVITEKGGLVTAIVERVEMIGQDCIHDIDNDVNYYNGEYDLYEMDSVPQWVRTYEHNYADGQFRRAYTMEEIMDARIGQIRNVKAQTEALKKYDSIKETQDAITIALAEMLGM